jgi:site-specific recombinase XerD
VTAVDATARKRPCRGLSGAAARASEICSLTVRDVVLEGDAPYVRVLGKGGVTRDCPLSLELVPIITNYLTSREERTGKPARRKDPLFLNTRLEPLTTAALDHSVRRCNRAGVAMPQGAAAHAFRHTVAMQLIERGESATVVQDLLGHCSLSSTQIYTKAAGRHVRAAANGLPVRQLVAGLSR